MEELRFRPRSLISPHALNHNTSAGPEVRQGPGPKELTSHRVSRDHEASGRGGEQASRQGSPHSTFSMPFNLRGEVSEHRHLPTRQAGGKTHPGPEKQARPLGADTWGPGCSHPRGPLPRCSSQEGGVAGEGGEGQGTAGEAAPGAPAAAGGTAAESRAAPGCPGGATAAEAAEEQGAFVRGPGQARVAPRARICMQARCVHMSAFTRAVRSRGAYISASVQARLVLCVPG